MDPLTLYSDATWAIHSVLTKSLEWGCWTGHRWTENVIGVCFITDLMPYSISYNWNSANTFGAGSANWDQQCRKWKGRTCSIFLEQGQSHRRSPSLYYMRISLHPPKRNRLENFNLVFSGQKVQGMICHLRETFVCLFVFLQYSYSFPQKNHTAANVMEDRCRR